MGEIPTQNLETLAQSFFRDGLDGHHMVIRTTLDGIAELRARLAASEKAREEAERERDEARRCLNATPNGHPGCAKDHSARLAEWLECWICKEEAAEARAIAAEARPSTCPPSELDTRWQAFVADFDREHRARLAAESRAARLAEALRDAIGYVENGDFSSGVGEFGADEGLTLWSRDLDRFRAALAAEEGK